MVKSVCKTKGRFQRIRGVHSQDAIHEPLVVVLAFFFAISCGHTVSVSQLFAPMKDVYVYASISYSHFEPTLVATVPLCALVNRL